MFQSRADQYHGDESHADQSLADQEVRTSTGWEEEVSSYATHHPYLQSLATHTARSVGSSVMPGGSKKKKKKKKDKHRDVKDLLPHLDEQESYDDIYGAPHEPLEIQPWDTETVSYSTQAPVQYSESFASQSVVSQQYGTQALTAKSVGSFGTESKK